MMKGISSGNMSGRWDGDIGRILERQMLALQVSLKYAAKYTPAI